MKEVHKILNEKLKPLFKDRGFKKSGDSLWYLVKDGFSLGIEIQKSQWSDDIYLNFYFVIHDSQKKPKKSDPLVTGRIYGPHIGLSNDEFNDALELSNGDILQKTNKIVEIIQKVLILLAVVEDKKGLKQMLKTGELILSPKNKINVFSHNNKEQISE